jgi:hypothetical protein
MRSVAAREIGNGYICRLIIVVSDAGQGPDSELADGQVTDPLHSRRLPPTCSIRRSLSSTSYSQSCSLPHPRSPGHQQTLRLSSTRTRACEPAGSLGRVGKIVGRRWRRRRRGRQGAGRPASTPTPTTIILSLSRSILIFPIVPFALSLLSYD